MHGIGLEVQDFGLRVQDLGFWDWGSGSGCIYKWIRDLMARIHDLDLEP